LILKKIILRNFRNYEVQEIDFNNRFNFIYGDNGHGKTNILEAISFLTYGRSFIGAVENECIKFGCDEFFVEGEFVNDLENSFTVRLVYNLSTRKKVYFLNGERVSSFSSDIFGRFPVVYLSPHSLNITYGNPGERRKFFDILIAQTNKLYLDYLKILSKILKQKNALLKNNLSNGNNPESGFNNILESYNEKLAEVSANIIFRRLNFLKDFISMFRKNFSELIFSDESSSINYFTDIYGEITVFEKLNVDAIQTSITNEISQRTGEEIARGISVVGPQRDDYIFRLGKSDSGNEETNGFILKNFGSQGEHKTFLVALKLAEYYLLKDGMGTCPILLLDDVLSELDAGRISNIISHLNNFGQVMLTTTDSGYSEGINKFFREDEISLFRISEGKVYDAQKV
jgi:DNA replication and repair protein RecF